MVWKFDRFARSVSHLLRALEKFQQLKIEFVSMTEQFDTSTSSGRLVFTVLGAVAQLERDLICERVSLGMHAAKAAGKAVGRPFKGIDEEKIRRDYQALGSLGKVASLNRCSRWLVTKVVRGEHAQPE